MLQIEQKCLVSRRKEAVEVVIRCGSGAVPSSREPQASLIPENLFSFFFSLPSFLLSFLPSFLSFPTAASNGGSQARGHSELQLLAYTTATATADP